MNTSLLLLSLALPLGEPASGPETRTASLAERVFEDLGATRFAVESIALPQLAEQIRVTVPHLGGERTLLLERHSVRSADAQLRAWRADGTYAELALPAPRTYRGTLATNPDASVVANLGLDGLSARIVAPGEADWSVVPLATLEEGAPRGTHVVFEEEDGQAFAAPCGVAPGMTVTSPHAPAGSEAWELHGTSSCQRLFEIAFDADFEYFQGYGSSEPNVVARIDEILNEVDFFYARDVNVTFELTTYVIRTAPFYAPVDGGDLLDQFRAEWNANQNGVPRDLAHLMTSKPGSIIEFGGLAWVGATCNLGLAYGWSLDGANIVGHEVGHNFGASHCHDTTPCNNMCGACHFIAPITKGVIEAYIDSKGCYTHIGSHPTALPPYVTPEGVSLRKDDLATLGTLAVDVLKNDQDGNCTPVHLSATTSPTPFGGTADISIGTGPKGRDELLYTPPAEVFIGEDVVRYNVMGYHGPVTPAELPVEVRPLELAGYWNLDEGTGSVVADLAASASDGVLSGAPTWISGPNGAALEFDGIDDEMAAPALNLDTDEATITAWIRRDGPQNQGDTVVFHRGVDSVGGLRMRTAAKIGYQWGHTIETWGWNSGLDLPDGVWVFVALTVAPERAQIHLWDGAMQVATNEVPHAPMAWDADVQLGFDSFLHFAGGVDDVRIYDYVLADQQILDLALAGGRAEIPSPTDGGLMHQAGLPLSWLPGLDALSHDVYFGSSYTGVESAGNGSRQFQGNQAPPFFTPPPLAFDTTYFWRVDEVYAGGTSTGQVWQFRLAEYDHWPLDETLGLVANNATGSDNGLYGGGPVLGEPGASAATGTSVRFDGVNDSVSITPLDLNADRVTITTWLRRDGNQSSFSGLVFSRAGSTVAGLNFGDADELRYHWNGSGSTWGWNSGLVVPDDTWTFAALVVEPDRATIYMSDGGVLVSAVNPVGHEPEEFDGPLVLAQDPTGGRFFDGWLDDVRVYRAALGGSQIQALFDAGR